MKRFITSFLTFCSLLLVGFANAQCSNFRNLFPTQAVTPSATWFTVRTTFNAGNYFHINAVPGDLEISTCQANTNYNTTWDTEITVLDQNGVVIGYNDDYCGNLSYINVHINYTGTVTVLISMYSCQSQTGTAGPYAACAIKETIATPPSTPQISGSSTLCNGSTTTLTVNNPCSGCNYTWYMNGGNIGTGSSYTASTAGTYTVQADNTGGTATSSPFTVNVSSPTVSISPQSVNLCPNGSAHLTASGNGITSYQWSDGQNGASVSTTQSGMITVTATNSSNCTATATAMVNALQGPTLSFTPQNPVICRTGGTVSVNVSGANSYAWTGGRAGANVTINAAGTYTVTGTDASGCSATASVNINSDPATVSISPTGTVYVCPMGTVDLNAVCSDPNASFSWTGGGQSATYQVSTSGLYTVTATNSSGCTATASKNVSQGVNPSAHINATGSTSICDGNSVRLTATGGNQYVWSSGETTASIQATLDQSYTVTTSNSQGCTATATIQVIVNPIPVAMINPDNSTDFCAGRSVNLTATGGTSYHWSTGSTNSTINVSTTGNYTVTVTAAGCSATASQQINVNPVPVFNLVSTICESAPAINLTGTPSGGNWIGNGVNSNSFNPSVAGQGVWDITYEVNGCQTTHQITVNTTASVDITITGNTTVCQGIPVILTATPGSAYHWSTGATTSTITVTASGNYDVTVTNPGCPGVVSANNPVAVTVNANPTVDAGADQHIQNGQSAILTATGTGNSYLWSNNSTNATISVSPANTTIYTVTTTDGNGCTASDQVTVSVCAILTPIVIVSNQDLMTSYQPGASYQWYYMGQAIPGATSRYYTATQNGYYSVVVSDSQDPSCAQTSADMHVIAGISIINGLDNPIIKISPNPVTNGFFRLTMDMPVDRSFNVNLMDMSGRVYKEFIIAPYTQSITCPLPDISEGEYLVIVMDNGNTVYTEKILVGR